MILSLRDELETMLARGHKLASLHAQLVEDGFLSSDFSSFFRLARKLKLGTGTVPPMPSYPAVPTSKPSPAIAAIAPSDELLPGGYKSREEMIADLSKPRTFVHNPDPDPKDFKP